MLLFISPTVYYTYAYSGQTTLNASGNLRAKWYANNKTFVKYSQWVLFAISMLLATYLFIKNLDSILALPKDYWLSIFAILFAGGFYYSLLPKLFFNLNLRNTGWLKAFIIGFVWACCANVLLLIILKIELGINDNDWPLWIWLFVKNWMFCTVNAIIFDIKDYPTDANKDLRTFAVRYGLRTTIFYILLPLLVIGLLSFYIFAYYRDFNFLQLFFNTLPFVATIVVAFSMRKRQQILYYLMVVDGLILFKAICGILGIVLYAF
ncbi:UbiA prenyltransferase family protein [Pedobacter planticolens]|uniref:hypothetical protein n=1 Tax=Pedobacter planticolens TaxID=2679964 RepID=UPI0019313171|nr:hypothetical protein [Pedobacter planticolens]